MLIPFGWSFRATVIRRTRWLRLTFSTDALNLPIMQAMTTLLPSPRTPSCGITLTPAPVPISQRRQTGNATAYGNKAYGSATTTGTFSPGQTFVYTKYGASAVIKVFKGHKPGDNANAFNAREVQVMRAGFCLLCGERWNHHGVWVHRYKRKR